MINPLAQAHYEACMAWKKHLQSLPKDRFDETTNPEFYRDVEASFGNITEKWIARQHIKYHAKKIAEIVRESVKEAA